MIVIAAAALALQLVSPSIVAAASCDEPNKDARVLAPTEPQLTHAQIKESHVKRATLIAVTVSPDGKAQHLAVVQSSGDATIDQSAMNAAKASTYAPATRNCAAVTGKYLFKVEVKPVGR